MRRARRPVRAIVAFALFASAWAVPVAGAQVPVDRMPCDPLDRAHCLLPFPNDRFTRPDPTTDTGLRIDLSPAEMPRSRAGKPIDPTEWNRNDGFSPGSMVLTFVPGIDLHRTWGTHRLKARGVGGPNDPRDHLADIGRYRAPSAPMLIIDATTGQRWPFWSELDMNAATADDERLLILRPARNFREGHRYLVALRNLRDAGGAVIPAGEHFAAYRDGTDGPDPTFDESRREHLEGVIAAVERAERRRGNPFKRSDLYLAWDFTIASERNLSERVLHMRDQSFAELGDTNLADRRIRGEAPEFEVTSVTPRDDGARLRQIEGTVRVPNYLDGYPLPAVEEIPETGLPMQALTGRRLLYGPDGLPMVNPAVPTIDVPFSCVVPAPATPRNRAHPLLYGHGLIGDRSEGTGGSTERDRERNFMPCMIEWMGFAQYDFANVVLTLADPSHFPTPVDRAQQGFLNWLFLGRALAHPQGLATDPAFQAGGRPLFRTGELFYDGNSQGGIMGGALMALSVDATRGVLGVPGMNYSTLLNRSVDWEGPLVPDEFDPGDPADNLPSYSSPLYTMFPDKQEQQVVMALLQMLWDRAEGNGYAHHMTTDPLPNTPSHQVLLHLAFDDFQVANVSAEVEARTIGARVLQTALAPGRHWALGGRFFGLRGFPRSGGRIRPWTGSAIVYWDSGNLTPPNGNVPPDREGGDPHEDPRRDPRAGDQKATFWLTGRIVDVHAGEPYLVCRPGAEDEIPRVRRLFRLDWCLAPPPSGE